eukprot:2883331-Prymnesium_polylepis.1
MTLRVLERRVHLCDNAHAPGASLNRRCAKGLTPSSERERPADLAMTLLCTHVCDAFVHACMCRLEL